MGQTGSENVLGRKIRCDQDFTNNFGNKCEILEGIFKDDKNWNCKKNCRRIYIHQSSETGILFSTVEHFNPDSVNWYTSPDKNDHKS